MILILTEADQTAVQPITPEVAAKSNLPAESVGKNFTELTQNAKKASSYAETVWHRTRDGAVVMIKSRSGLPAGTPVTLFSVAELFGIKVNRDVPGVEADSADRILRDIVELVDVKAAGLDPRWKEIFSRAEAVLAKT